MLDCVADVVVGPVGEISQSGIDFIEEPKELLHLLPRSGNLFLHDFDELFLPAGNGDVHWTSVRILADCPETVLDRNPLDIKAELIEHLPDVPHTFFPVCARGQLLLFVQPAVEEPALSFLCTLLIGEDLFQDMQDFQLLNEIAGHYIKMQDISQIRFKAALEHDKPTSLEQVKEIMENESKYNIDPDVVDEDNFFKRYLSFYTDERIDPRWFSTVHAYYEGVALLERMGGAVTQYGACSARGKSLFEIVPYDNPQVAIDQGEEQTEENNMTMGGM